MFSSEGGTSAVKVLLLLLLLIKLLLLIELLLLLLVELLLLVRERVRERARAPPHGDDRGPYGLRRPRVIRRCATTWNEDRP